MLVTSHAILKNGFQETLASSYHTTCPYFQKLLNRHFEFRHSFTEIVDICMYTTTTHVTANAKDFEVIKKFHGFWVIQLKNSNMFH